MKTLDSMRDLLLPQPPRTLKGYRAISIALRTVHIFGFGVLLGVAASPRPETPGWAHAVAGASGVLLLMLECYVSAAYLVQGAGLMLIAKLGLLYLAYRLPGATIWLLAVIVVLGSVASHMPGRMRHWSPFRSCRFGWPAGTENTT